MKNFLIIYSLIIAYFIILTICTNNSLKTVQHYTQFQQDSLHMVNIGAKFRMSDGRLQCTFDNQNWFIWATTK